MSIEELASDQAKYVVLQAKIRGALVAHKGILEMAQKEVETGDPIKVEVYGKQVLRSQAIIDLIEEELL